MDNAAGTIELKYTTEYQYEGYAIDWTTSPSKVEREKFVGHFRAYRNGVLSLWGFGGPPHPTAGEAKKVALRMALSVIDAAATRPS